MSTTRKNIQIAQNCGSTLPAATLQAMRGDARFTTEAIAAALGTSPQVYLNEVAKADPVSERPINWTAVNAPGVAPYCPAAYVGVDAQVYAHPWYPGFTWGTPVYVNV